MRTLPRLDTLTGLRFFAALAVVLYHMGVDAAWAGPAAVSFFFVLSGFVMAWSARSGDSAACFWWRRIARIAPLHLLLWVYYGALVAVSGGHFAWRAFALGMPLLQAWYPDFEVNFAFNGPAWSLSVEAFFYLCCPLLLPACARLGCRAALVAAGAIYLLVLGGALVGAAVLPTALAGWALGVFPPARLAEFAIGVLLATAMRAGWRPRLPMFLPAGVVFAWSAVPFLTGAPALGGRDYLYSPVLLPALAGLVLAGAGRDLRQRRVLPGLVALGDWSYAIYLAHVPLWRTLTGLGLDERPGAKAAYLALVVLGAGALHRVVERPAEAWLRPRGPRLPGQDGHGPPRMGWQEPAIGRIPAIPSLPWPGTTRVVAPSSREAVPGCPRALRGQRRRTTH